MSHSDIVAYMNARGWGYGESRVLNHILVTFSRPDWHGRRLERTFTVSSWGHPEARAELVRQAGREALELWARFPEVPQRFYDAEQRRLVWDLRSARRARSGGPVARGPAPRAASVPARAGSAVAS